MDGRTREFGFAGFMRQAFLLVLLPSCVLLLFAPFAGHAQVTNITQTLGPGDLGTQVLAPAPNDIVYGITGGKTIGTNLFHSFGDFSVGAGDIAQFQTSNLIANQSMSNILGRVTGGDPSGIFGTIDSATYYPAANLFLMNPFGILFGPGASLNVGGAASFTNAQYIRLFDGVNNTNFYANPLNDGLANSILVMESSLLLEFLSPAAYGFLTAPDPNATITVQGSTLSVPFGQSISLIGGKVIVEGGAQLSAPSGRIHLATTASPGEFAAFEPLANATSLQSVPTNPVDAASATSFTSYGLMSLAPGSSIDVQGATMVFIKGGQLVLSVNDATLSTTDTPTSPGTTDTVLLGSGSSILTSNSGTDPGADVQMTAGTVQMDGAMIQTINSGDLDGGNISINATTVGLTNGTFQAFTGLDFNTGTIVGSGNGGNVTVQGLRGAGSHADLFALSNSVILTQTVGPGNGGEVQLNASTFTMDNFSSITTGTSVSDEGQGGGGVGGDVVLNVRTGRLLEGASILGQTNNVTPEGGQGGNVIIQGLQGAGSAAESITLSGGSFLKYENFRVSNGGRVEITSKALTMDGARTTINSEVSDVGHGGDVVVNVQQARLSGGATITTKTISTQAGPAITVQGLPWEGRMAGSVILSGSGTGIISDSTGGTTRAGDVAVHATSLTLADGAVIQAATTVSTGVGGNVTIEADSVDLSRGSRISSQASDSDAGQINITTNTFALNNSSIATNTQGQGRAGDIVLDAGSVGFSNGALMNSSSTGIGNAGNITITSKSSVIMQDSSITTTSDLSSGGQVTINTPEMLQLINSNITTSVKGIKGDTAGGNITIDPNFVILQNSNVLAQANAGTGGDITIISNVFLADPNSLVDASSKLGVSGTVNIQAPVQNVSGELVVLSQDFSSAAALLAQQCAARVADGKFSTFVVAAREGLPVEPGGFLASPSFLTELGGSTLSGQPLQIPRSVAGGLFPEYGAKPLQLAKLGNACRQ